jgi:hypothetical protein
MKRILIVSAALLLVAGCDSFSTQDDASQIAPGFAGHATSSSADVIEGHYIVVLSKQPAARDVAADIALESVTAALSRGAGASVNHTYRHALTGFAAELTDEQVEGLRRDPRVLSIEQDGWVYPAYGGIVQEYPTWGLDRIDQREPLLDRAYAYTETGQGVTAYIIDSGIRYSHEEFGGRASLGYDFVLEETPENTDPNQGPGEDCSGHGTHVAGTVGGTTYGVAKGASLISVRVFGCGGGSPHSRVLAAVEWVTANAAHPAVVNMSLSGYSNELTQSTEMAIQNSIEGGVHYVAAAANFNEDACLWSPALLPGVLTVGAVDIGGRRAWFSNYGSCVDIFAPGVQIESAGRLSDHQSLLLNGTSMAAPHVAGVVALYLEANPGASPAEVHAAILANSTPNVVTDVPSGTTNLLYSLWQPVDFIPPQPSPLDVGFAATGLKVRGKQVIDLTWNPVNEWIEVTRDGSILGHAAPGSGFFRDDTGISGNHGTYVHQICETSQLYLLPACSEKVTTIFGDGGGDEPPPPGDGPTASFTYSCGNSPTCQFTDTSTEGGAAIESRDWVTGDKTASGSQVSFTFGSAGDHVVTLTVTDADEATDQTSKAVNCKAHPRHGLRCS